VSDQLSFNIPRDPGDLSDLNFTGHRARLDRMDGVDYAAPRASTCACEPHGLPVEDEFGELTCWLCGHEVPR
jgi:hypothetical protein